MTTSTIAQLTDLVTEQAGALESPAEAVAVIEALGYGDNDAEAMGYGDTFVLGLMVYQRQSDDEGARLTRNAVEQQRRAESLEKKRPSVMRQFLPRFFAKGFTFGLPQVIMIFAVLILLYSLWAYFFFDVPRGSAIGVGIVGSYVVTAGFMQAIGRRGLMYLRQDMNVLSLKISLLMIALGTITVFITAGLLWLALLVFPVIAPAEIPIAVLYFVTLSLLWLGLSIVYMLQQEIWFSIDIAAGILVVYLCREFIGLPVVVSHQIGLLFSAGFGLAIGSVLLLNRERQFKRVRKDPLAGELPRASVIAYSVAPYFAYGAVYFTFLFTDRVMAWTGQTSFRQSFVWFQSDYEVGLNWALISLLFSLGVLEFTVYRLGELVLYYSEVLSIKQAQLFSERIISFYRRAVLAFLAAAIIGVIFAFVLVQVLISRVPLIDTLLNEVSVIVFVFASISYLFVVWSLLNNVVIFSFSRPSFALRAAVPALATNIVVGFMLSRMFVYWASVFGLLAGALVYWALSTHYAMKMLRRMDYYAYSGF